MFHLSDDFQDACVALVQRSPDDVEVIEMADRMVRDALSPITVTVVNEDDHLVHWVSSRRITGVFHKEIWAGRNGDDAVHQGTEHFDATNEVLLLSLSELHELEDRRDSTDEIGSRLVQWEGPRSVYLTDSVLEFFGVHDLQCVTEEHLELAKALYKPSPLDEVLIEVTLQVRVVKTVDMDWKDVADRLAFHALPTTDGSSVIETIVTGKKVLA